MLSKIGSPFVRFLNFIFISCLLVRSGPINLIGRMKDLNITANVVDIFEKKVYPASIKIRAGRIAGFEQLPETAETTRLPYAVPGFVDAHVHVESSMLCPAEFARLAVVHGTVATVSDPHEIANVCGIEGVEYMIRNGLQTPFKFSFGAPSCVPATVFETAGAQLDSAQVEQLLSRPEIRYLSEMMNFPGVLNKDPEVMKKLETAHRLGKPVDGHAPGLRGTLARQYIEAGIYTDHECFTLEEAQEKLSYGMKILIREGSAAKNFEALIPLLHQHPDSMMFCNDDKHPDSLVAGHINQLCERAVAKGIDVFHVLKAACINPVLHYRMPVGLLRIDDPADFVLLEDLTHFKVLQTYIDGELVAENGQSLIQYSRTSGTEPINRFECRFKTPDDFVYRSEEIGRRDENGPFIHVIEALDGQLITNKLTASIEEGESILSSNTDQDILKIVVVNRYHEAPVAKSFIRQFGLKKGAIASSVAHDSHNIVAVGVDDESICRAVNMVIGEKGGVSCVSPEVDIVLPLPVAGLMSEDDGYEIAEAYTAIDSMAKSLGSALKAPFMTLSFMALLVIPHLKLSDKGLFDGDQFKFV